MRTLIILLLLSIPCYADTLRETIYGDLVVNGYITSHTVTATNVSAATITGTDVSARYLVGETATFTGKGSFDTLDLTGMLNSDGPANAPWGGDEFLQLENYTSITYLAHASGGEYFLYSDEDKDIEFGLYADVGLTGAGTFRPGITLGTIFSASETFLRSYNPFNLYSNGDSTDYIQFKTVGGVPEITTVGGGDLTISASISAQTVTTTSVSANTVIATGTIYNKADNSKHYFGEDDDYSIEWDGSDAVHTITAGDFVFTGGNVGIGTTSPDSVFHIKADVPGNVGSHSAGQLIIQNPTDTVWSNVIITAYESDGSGNPDQQLWYLGSASTGNSDITFLNRRNSKLTLGTNGTSHITILGNGNVGIGEASPQDTLEVNGTGLFKDKLKFTQTDGNEYIDSLNDGYMDYGATTAHRFDRIVTAPTVSATTITGNTVWTSEIINKDGVLKITGTSVLVNSLPFGNLYVHEASQTVDLVENEYVIIDGFSVGFLHDIRATTANMVAIYEGYYTINWSLSVDAAAANQDIEFDLFLDGVEQVYGTAQRNFATANDKGNVASNAIIRVPQGSALDLRAKNTTSSNDMDVTHANFSILRVGE